MPRCPFLIPAPGYSLGSLDIPIYTIPFRMIHNAYYLPGYLAMVITFANDILESDSGIQFRKLPGFDPDITRW